MVAQGIHVGLGMEEYHSWKLDKAKLIEGPISCSTLKAFDPNPYAWLKSPPFKPSKAMETGSLFDAAVTDPDTLSDLLPTPIKDHKNAVELPFDSLRTKAAREWKNNAEAEGLEVLTSSQIKKRDEDYLIAMESYEANLDHLTKAREAVFSHPIAGKILEGADFQVGVVGEIGGIPAKCLLDILPNKDGDYAETIPDYKTISTGIDDESVRKAIGKFRYHWQSAFYRSLFNKVSVDRLCEEFKFIFQDIVTLEVRVVTLDQDSMDLGTRAVKHALINFRKCAEKGIRSKYLKTDHELALMPYHAMSEDEELCKREGGAM